MPGLDVLARDLHFGLGSVEGAVDHARFHTIAIACFLLALYARLPHIVSIHRQLRNPADSKPRGQCLASRADAIHHCSEASTHRYIASGQLGPLFRVC